MAKVNPFLIAYQGNDGTIDLEANGNKGSSVTCLQEQGWDGAIYNAPSSDLIPLPCTHPYIISKGFKMEEYYSQDGAHSLSLLLTCTLSKCVDMYAAT